MRSRSWSTGPGAATSSSTSTRCSTSTTPASGADVVSGAHFDTWWKPARREDPELLTFDPAMLVNETADVVDERTTRTCGRRAR